MWKLISWLWPELPHVGRPCVYWCYACERHGLQERVKFTADYESKVLALEQAIRERDAWKSLADIYGATVAEWRPIVERAERNGLCMDIK